MMSTDNYIPIRDFTKTKLVSRVEDSIMKYIREQSLLPGDSLPSQAKLAEALGISSSTLREALTRLEERGIIQIEHGKGTFLKRDMNQQEFHIDLNLSLTQMISSQGMVPGSSEIGITMEKLPEDFQGILEGNADKDYLCLRRVRTSDEKPIAFSLAYFDDRFIPYKDGLAVCTGSVYDFIKSNTKETITKTDAKLYAEIADKFISEKLDIKAKSPLLVLRQVHMNDLGEHLIVTDEFFFDCQVDVKITNN
jgi:GntR family transcriptional regulator